MLGFFLLTVSAVLALWHGKRRFSRKNAYGVEQFPGFFRKLGSKSLDASIRAGAIGIGVIAILVLAKYFESSGGCLILLVVYGAMLFILVGA